MAETSSALTMFLFTSLNFIKELFSHRKELLGCAHVQLFAARISSFLFNFPIETKNFVRCKHLGIVKSFFSLCCCSFLVFIFSSPDMKAPISDFHVQLFLNRCCRCFSSHRQRWRRRKAWKVCKQIKTFPPEKSLRGCKQEAGISLKNSRIFKCS